MTTPPSDGGGGAPGEGLPGDVDDDEGFPGRRRRRWWPWVTAVVVVGLSAWVGVATMQLFQAANAVRDARDDVTALRDVSPADLLKGDTLDRLERAQARLDTAAGRTGSPLMAPLKLLPVLGRQLRSADALATAGADGLGAATSALSEVRTLLDQPLQSGAERVAVLRSMHNLAVDALATVNGTDLGPSKALFGPLRDARVDLDTELRRVHDLLTRSVAATDGLADLLEGPHRYLLVAANNAEMRAATGFFGSLGVLQADQGVLSVSQVVASSELIPDQGAVSATGDLEARWGWLQPAGDFRNLGLSPDFPSTAKLALDMWEATKGERLDGVIAVDPDFLKAILKVTGPLDVGDRSFDATGVVQFLLNEQYAGITDYEAGSDYAARKDYLSQVTAAALAAVNSRDLDAATLVESLRQAAQGRHVLAWSALPDQQAAFEAATVDGSLHNDSLVLSVINRSSTKLDWYLDIDADLTTAAVAGGTEVSLDVQLRNEAPVRESPYVIGPNPLVEPQLVDGQYFGILAVNVPRAATDVRIEGTDRLASSGPDGPTQVVMGFVDLQRRDTRHYIVRFILPPGTTSLRVEPTGRVPTVDWTLPGLSTHDGEGHRVTFA